MGIRKDFIWGAATASYQIEGAYNADGKGVSIWDTFVHEDDNTTSVPNNGGGYDTSGRIANGDTGDVACDHYNRFKEDVAIMKQLGLKAYRFSIAWTRIMPKGTGEICELGLKFYSDLVDELLGAGIEPFVTLFHWDYPQVLQDREGWLNPESPKWFEEYVKIVVDRLSDRVTNWITFNEPLCMVNLGHDTCIHAPGIKYSEKEKFMMVHQIMLAHGMAVKTIRAHSKIPCKVGIAPNMTALLPANDSPSTIEFARQATFSCHEAMGLWSNSWWLDPILLGKYPEDGLAAYKNVLPDIKEDDLKIINQPLDFLGINLYQGIKVAYDPIRMMIREKNDPGYPATSLQWKVEPSTLYYMPKFLHERYGLPIYITENGMANLDWKQLDGKVQDPQRTDFLHRYLKELKRGIEDGVDIRGYFCWSLMDNFEWSHGYTQRFGLVFVDYVTQERIVKDSGYWYKSVIETNGDEL